MPFGYSVFLVPSVLSGNAYRHLLTNPACQFFQLPNTGVYEENVQDEQRRYRQWMISSYWKNNVNIFKTARRQTSAPCCCLAHW